MKEKWCLVRYFNFANHRVTLTTKAYQDFAKRLDFKDIRFPVKARGIHKIGKKNSVRISVSGYVNKEKHPIYVSKQLCGEKYVDLSLKWEWQKNTMFLSEVLIRSCITIH